jgi:putative membrane-bound dehydrogenase-like protein
MPGIKLAGILVLGGVLAVSAQLPADLKNTQSPPVEPPSPQEALAKITLPDGFTVTLFAGDPHVAQPIAINYDDRGRLWVAESFSYIEWKRKGQDRISIFEDTDNDGEFDKRKVFWSQANHLSGFQIGYGGVWVCDAPQLLFIPDADRDDVPDGEPQVVLDGWAKDAEHNFFNGLTWGPDGWLYGRHGIKKPSKVGRPGTPEEDRIDLSCSIWRFHPIRKEFEIVADGTINPWGLDWNADGQPFITTSVVDHLWHLVPGARFERWENRKGGHPNPYTYKMMKPASDHRHWAGGEKERRQLGHDEQGGGHSHCGLMFYQAKQWPKEYRGRAFMNNIHGHRVNMDQLQRRHSGYVATHGGDFLQGNNDWFRSIDIIQSPDGGAMLSEWTDLGECHDRDGIHRTSGRLFKINYRDSAPVLKFDLQARSDWELVALLWHDNAWWARRALRILQERIASGRNLAAKEVSRIAARASRDVIAVQALASLQPERLPEVYSETAREAIRAQIVHLLCHRRKPAVEVVEWLVEQVPAEKSALVRIHMASALQRIDLDDRWELAKALTQLKIDPADRNLALLIWYGFEPLVAADGKRALGIGVRSKIPLIRQFTARRIADGRKAD